MHQQTQQPHLLLHADRRSLEVAKALAAAAAAAAGVTVLLAWPSSFSRKLPKVPAQSKEGRRQEGMTRTARHTSQDRLA
jgi:hypothetical protein